MLKIPAVEHKNWKGYFQKLSQPVRCGIFYFYQSRSMDNTREIRDAYEQSLK